MEYYQATKMELHLHSTRNLTNTMESKEPDTEEYIVYHSKSGKIKL